MSNPDFLKSLRTYLIENFQEVEHPAEPYAVSRMLLLDDAHGVVDALLALLQLPTAVAEARDVAKRVLSAFERYLSASPLETEHQVDAACNLVLGLEPFLKKLFAMRHPNTTVPSHFSDLLRADIASYQGKFRCKLTDEKLLDELRKQRTEEAVLHDAYCFRNIEAHEARRFRSAQFQRYWRSVVAAFLLIAQRNMDLIPAVRKRAERAAQIRRGLRLCLENVRAQFDDAKWHNEYYIPLSIDQGRMLDEYVDAFLRGQADRLLAITGRMGAGKSTFLEGLTAQLADQALHVLGSGLPGNLVVPVHLELKRYTSGRRTDLVRKLHNVLDPNGRLGIGTQQISSWPRILLPNRIVVCLDGLDEVSSKAWPIIVAEIEELGTDFDNVQVILASRLHAVPDHWNQLLVHILPLPRKEVIAYFGQRLNQLATPIQAFLKSKPDLVDILQDPLMAEAACRYWRTFEPADSEASLDPSVRREALLEGPLLDHLYQSLFTHLLHRAFRKQIMDYERAKQVDVLAKLALEMDGDPFANFELIAGVLGTVESGAPAVQDLLELFVETGLLRPQDNEFAFRNHTVKAYFAAVGLRSLTRREQDLGKAFSFIRQANEFWRRCVKLLKEIAPSYGVGAVEGYLASIS
jgi:hypothetical protein